MITNLINCLTISNLYVSFEISISYDQRNFIIFLNNISEIFLIR